MSLELEPSLRLALAMHHGRGVYALLLGSGVSRAAGIMTGWEIILDLINQVALAKGETAPSNPEEWYRLTFGKEPTYSKLVTELAPTPAERTTLLRPYFEPTEQEIEQGLKVPTAAHRAVAKLVKDGYVRLILTTNFDRLTETALETEGIQADVVRTQGDFRGVLPVVHSTCLVVKLHGDYRDTRIKNTRKDLATYSQSMNAFLDQVLDEFGLVVCGWSATWDTALRDAISRAPNRRFTTYWLSRGRLSVEATEIANQRRADVLVIEDANDFFSTLVQQVRSLAEFQRPHPLSIAAAVGSLKRHIADPLRRIPLQDLMTDATQTVIDGIESQEFSEFQQPVDESQFQARLHRYEAISERLMAMVAALAFYDPGKHTDLIVSALERLSRPSRTRGVDIWRRLQYYPALLICYAAGLGALGAARFETVAKILREPNCIEGPSRKKAPLLHTVNNRDPFVTEEWMPREGTGRGHTPVSTYLFGLMRAPLRQYLPDDIQFNEAFDILEYLIGVTYRDVVQEEGPAPIGRFARAFVFEQSQLLRQVEKWQLVEGGDASLVQAGFFDGNHERLAKITYNYNDWVKKIAQVSW